MRKALALVAAAALVGAPTAASARPHVAGHSERLAARARRGDRVARTALVEEHMGLVRSIAFRYRDLGLPIEDLVQEGVIGLLNAVDGYDDGRGASFSTYAFWRIRAAVTHALTADGQLLRVPRPVLERRRLLAEARRQLVEQGREPTATRLAEATALAEGDVIDALNPITVSSLDRPTCDGAALAESVAGDPATWPEARVLDRDEARSLYRAMLNLPKQKRTILSRHFGLAGDPQTLTEIAGDLQLSPERTRALKDEALRQLAVDLEPAVGAP